MSEVQNPGRRAVVRRLLSTMAVGGALFGVARGAAAQGDTRPRNPGGGGTRPSGPPPGGMPPGGTGPHGGHGGRGGQRPSGPPPGGGSRPNGGRGGRRD